MNRAERRRAARGGNRIERAIRAQIERAGDNCSICGVQHNSVAYGGIDYSGAVAYVGECCVHKLRSISAICMVHALPDTAAIAADMSKKAGLTLPIHPVKLEDTPWKTDDRNWFEANPNRSHRVRPSFPGEFEGDHELLVIVRQIEPGQRIRLVVNLEAPPIPDVESVAHALFDLYACSGRKAGEEASVREVVELALKYESAAEGGAS
jgi:hypothetical protein